MSEHTDDAYGGYRGMWRDAETEVARLRARAESAEALLARAREALSSADGALVSARNGLDHGLAMARQVGNDWSPAPTTRLARFADSYLREARRAHKDLRAVLAEITTTMAESVDLDEPVYTNFTREVGDAIAAACDHYRRVGLQPTGSVVAGRVSDILGGRTPSEITTASKETR